MRDTAEELFREFARIRDPELLGRVYDLVAPDLLHVALHLVGRPAEAEDVLQSTFLAAIERAQSYDSTRPLRPWLLGILTNQARLQRARAARTPDPERLATRASVTPGDAAEREELAELLGEKLLDLPRAYRPVLTLRLRHGLNATEIAHALGRPPGTVRSQMVRGLELLRRTLPAGLAGALVAVLGQPGRGLSSVREAVLGRAAALQLAATLLPLVPGVLLMKPALTALGITLAVVLGWSLLRDAPTTATPLAAPRAPGPIAPPELAAGGPEASGRRAAPVEARRPARTTARIAAPALPAATRAGALTVHARWSEDESPAAGLVVLVDPRPSASLSPDRIVLRTDANGHARVDGLAPGPVRVRLLQGGETTVLIRADDVVSATLDTHAGMTVSGEVVDGNGTGIPDAAIWLSQRWSWNDGYVATRADRAGRFRLRAVSQDQTLAALAPGRAISHQHPVRGRPGDEITVRIVLPAVGGELSGRVVASDGRPVPQALVQIGTERRLPTIRTENGFHAPDSPPRRVRADAAGFFRVVSIPAGPTELQARALGFAPWTGATTIDADRPGELEIRLLPEARVHGRVHDRTGAPIASAWIHTPQFEGFAGVSTTSGIDGTFTLRGLPGGEVVLRVRREGLGEIEQLLDLMEGTETRWDPELGGRPGIHGTLLGADGAPLEGWAIVALPQPVGEERHRSEHTDAAGRWAVPAAGAERLHTLWVQPPQGWREFPRAILTDVRPGPEPVEIRLEPEEASTATLVARIVGPNGDPVPGAILTVWHEERRLWRSFETEGRTGTLEVAHLPPGTLHLDVRSNAHPWLSLGSRRVDGGELVDLGTLALAEPSFVAGELIGVPSEALESLALAVIGADGREAGVIQRTGRRFRSSPLEAGSYVVAASGDFLTSVQAEVEIPAGGEVRRDLHFEPAGLRRVVFIKPLAARTPRSLWCEALDASGQRAWLRPHVEPDAEGRLSVDVSAPPGSYRLVGTTNNGLAIEATLEVIGFDGAQAALEVELFRPRED